MGHVKPLKEACRLARSATDIRGALDECRDLVDRLGLGELPAMPPGPATAPGAAIDRVGIR
jgi:hypothetical protein